MPGGGGVHGAPLRGCMQGVPSPLGVHARGVGGVHAQVVLLPLSDGLRIPPRAARSAVLPTVGVVGVHTISSWCVCALGILSSK